MSFVDDFRAWGKKARQARRDRMAAQGLPDPDEARAISATWALLRNDLAARCAAALADGHIALAQRHARRWKAADERSCQAQERANKLERELSAALKGLQ